MAESVHELKTREEELCYLAALEGNATNVVSYLKRGADITALSHSPLLGEVAKKGNIEVLGILLAAGADVNYASAETGITALMQASRAGQTETVQFLLDQGASVGITPEERLHTLSWAVMRDNDGVFQILLGMAKQ